jgi:hypothetical protein
MEPLVQLIMVALLLMDWGVEAVAQRLMTPAQVNQEEMVVME